MPNKKIIAILKPLHRLVLIMAMFSIFSSCSVYQTISNISRLKYKIYSATDYKLIGITIADKKSLKDFHSIELLKITSGFVRGNLPLTFLLNVEAKNPNDGYGGFAKTDLNIASFPWRLYLNEKEIVQGNIDQPVFVPGMGESVLIPIKIEFDIAKSFKEKSMDDIILLLLQAGGAQGSTSNIKLIAKLVLGTPYGKLEYPDEITIVDKSFN